jgi:hypothetical protein
MSSLYFGLDVFYLFKVKADMLFTSTASQYLKAHMHKVLQIVFHILASFGNIKYGRGQNFKYSFYLNLKYTPQ